MPQNHKPYSESCDQNKDPIFNVIQPLLQDDNSVLEIGCGTGQHAIYFASKLPHIVWHTSDCEQYLPGIQLWIEEARLDNIRTPFLLNVSTSNWPEINTDAVYSANTCHIMHMSDVEALFSGVGKHLKAGGKFFLYGPFNYNGDYTSESNARFDQWLKSRDPKSAIRHFEELNKLAEQAGLELQHDYAMPANNRILYWQKI